jgi:crotonobetainyl-CoA:carnitine CoA-transferase CaiB-like acyl-CoA transferase
MSPPWRRDVAEITALLPGEAPGVDHITIVDATDGAASAFDVDRLLTGTAVHATAALDALAGGGEAAAARTVELDHVLAFCTTHVEVDGAAVPAWADLSGVYPTADGRHLQIHCNFPHHATGLVDLLGTTDERDAVAAAIAARNAFDLEAEMIDAGMIGAAVRTLDEWNAHPHALATSGLPLVSVEQIGPGPPRRTGPSGEIRVLDSSRVLAGPVAGQLLASFGADVLRLGAEHLPSVPVGVMSTGFGKRNAFADMRTEPGRATTRALLAGADIWIDAFRPGAMAGHGFPPDHVATQRPGIVIVQISAFDWVGPWGGRRGFDSIVQSTTGIRWAGGEFAVDRHGAPSGSAPVGLPVQALDYATGFLAAGVAAQLVRHQRDAGGSWLARVSLLRTRNRLAAMRDPRPFVSAPVRADPRYLSTVESDFGRLTAVRPFAGVWPHPPMLLGSSDPAWR